MNVLNEEKEIISYINSKGILPSADVTCNRLKEGNANDVWEIMVGGGQRYVLKKFRKETAFHREVVSYQFFNEKHFPASNIAFKENMTMLYVASGATITEKLGKHHLQSISNHLASLHNLDTSSYQEMLITENHKTQPNLILEKAITLGGYTPSRRSFTHGDVWEGNCIFSGNKLIHFIDFEEAGISDPLIDLTIALIECCWVGRSFNEGKETADFFKQAYFNTIDFGDLVTYFNKEREELLLSATLSILRKWAVDNNCEEVFEKYRGLSF